MKWQDCSKISLVFTGVLSFAVMVPAAEDTWTKKADMPTARNLLSTCVANGKIYAIGGAPGASTSVSAVEEYNPTTDKWTKRTNIPEARCGLSTSSVDGKIYAVGGATSELGAVSSRMYVYDRAADTWTRKADMPTARAYSSAGVVNGRIYVIGGAPSGIGLAYKTVEEYDPAMDAWTKKADMPRALCCNAAGVVNGKIYVVGGAAGGTLTGLSAVDAYDPATDTWTRKADMPTPRLVHSVSVVNGKIYCMGGGPSSNVTVSTVEEYDPVTDTWTTKTPMPTALWGHSSSEVNGKIYAVGGALNSNVRVSTVEEYDTGLTVPPPDFNGDEIVNFKDFSILVQYWFQQEPSVDIAPPPFGDRMVDFKDLTVLAEYWLKEVLPTDLIAYWKLDETEGGIAQDSAGDNDGTLNGNPVWQPAGGKVNGALQFDGIDDYVSTPFILDPASPPDGGFSVFAWIKGGAPGQVVISQTGGANWLSASPVEGKLMTELKAPGRFGMPLFSEAVIIDGAWHRVGLTWDGSTRTLLVDNVEAAKGTQGTLASSTSGLHIGAGKGLEPGSFWTGLIDDIRIYDRAVTP
jgi:N-acetylneuraminic acid mutarotase